MIHVCFALYDKAGHYSKFLGTAMVSLFENTDSQITVHLLHDNTLTQDNRDKFIQIAERYEQQLKFYNVEELCADRFEQISVYFPDIYADRHSIATFYRFFILNLLPQEIEKVIYLDLDLFVNFDIAEFWQIELGDKPFGAVPEFYQMKDEEESIKSRKKSMTICREGVVNPEDYFNAGVMFMNLKVLRNEEATISAGMKFISEHPQFQFLDQDILNYCFSTTYLKLPTKFNRFVLYARPEDELIIQENIYHYAASRMCFTMDMNDPYNRLWMDYFMKTPWVDADTKIALSGGLPSRKYHAVSVVIPMYNVAEFIGDCLDSLLIQTFQDFEIIVVDDCSTDDSVKIVEEYAPKFNGRLKLTKTEKNSGGGGHVPRNIGLMMARGDYLYFVDADDMVLGNALETMYKAAIFYNADVVYTSSYYNLKTSNDVYLAKDGVSKKNVKVKTEFIIDDPNKNLSRLLLEGRRETVMDSWTKLVGPGNDLAVWTKLISRDFLLRNKIFFANIPTSGDAICTINIYCHARRLLRISIPLYLHRSYNNNSITRIIRSPQEQCSFWLFSFVEFAKALHELEKKNAVLAENPIYCLEALRIHFTRFLKLTEEARIELDSRDIYEVLHGEFVKSSDSSLSLLLPFLVSFVNNMKNFNDYYFESISKFKNYFTARIDVKLRSTAGDFQIVSVSDAQAIVRKPIWLQKNGVGYMIQSYVGELEILAMSTVDEKIDLDLRGLDIRDSEDKSKRIPYWIDYTKLTINDKLIFDTLKSIWHNKPYHYTLEVKASEEIKIRIEWQPHRADTIEIAPPKAEPKVVPPPVKVESSIPDSFKPFITARIDTKLMTTAGNFQIVSVSDDKATVEKPRWLQKGGLGYQLESYAGKLDFIAEATADGQIQLRLRALDVRDPENNSKRIPYWIDYTNLTVNGETILDTLTPTWLHEPYTYTIDAKAHEEIKINVEWLPHRADTIEIAPPPPVKVESSIPDNFKPFFTARIDTKLMSKEGDFQIFSVSDDKATLKKPKWLQKGGVGYQLESYAGQLDFIAKTTADGQIQLRLRGLDVRDPENNAKRIPHWIDYTKLTINDKPIFDTLTPAWLNDSYTYTIDAKANEEIKIHIEWLPHRSDT